MTVLMRPFFAEYVSPEFSFAQCEAAGLSLRIGNRAWCFGHLNYRDKSCPWPRWARLSITLRHQPYPGKTPEWGIWVFGKSFRIGGKDKQ